MQKYKAPSLNDKTSEADKSKLVSALKAVQGVESATLRPASHEFEIRGKDKQEPKRDAISAAAAKAGFTISA
jgi:hypothetical protein